MEVGLFSVGSAFYIEDKETASNDSMEHLGLEYIAAVLQQKGFSVTITNILNEEQVIQYLTSFKPSIIGFTTTCATIKSVLYLTLLCRKIAPDIVIVCGGHLATFAPERLLAAGSEIDILVRGEGELAFAELCELLRDNKSYENCLNLSFRKDNSIVNNSNRGLIENLDMLPYPVREVKKNNSMSISYRISGSRGCYGNCSFCSAFVGRGQRPIWRGRSIANIVDEIEYLIKTYNADTFDFVDASFEDPPDKKRQRLLEFANEIKKRKLNIQFNCNFRADNWSEEDIEVIEALEQVGLERVFIGIESGVSTDLKLFRKKASCLDNLNTIQLFKNRRLANLTFGYIMFHPYATFESLKKSADFLYTTGISHDIRNYFTRLEVYPGTDIYRRLLNDGLIHEKNDFSEFYDYHFMDSDVEGFCNSLHQLLGVDKIFEYIDCDMRVFSYLSRLYRRRTTENALDYSDVDKLYQELLEVRHSMVEYNYHFFIRLMSQYKENGYVDIAMYAKELEQFIHTKISDLRIKQFKQMKKRRKYYEG